MLIATTTVVSMSPLHTLTLALLVFFVGVALTQYLPLLQQYGIPEAVTGGLIAALVTWVCFAGFNVEITFDLTIRDQLFLVFFATIGLKARLADVWLGGQKVLTLLLLTLAFIFAQNGLALLGTQIFELPHPVGVLLGSAALVGGHGSAIAWSTVVEAQSKFAAVEKLAIATATLGLIAGGILGSPIATLLIRRYCPNDSFTNSLTQTSSNVTSQLTSNVSSNSVIPITTSDVFTLSHPSVLKTNPPMSPPISQELLTPSSISQAVESENTVTHRPLMYTMLVTLMAVVIGQGLHGMIVATGFTLPTFIPCLLVAMVMTNTIPWLFPQISWPTKTAALELLTEYSLSIFLAMSLMGMQLWTVMELGGPLIVVFLVQIVVAIAFTILIIFPSMGADYDAAVLSAGFAGYSLGSTATALANMTTITQKYRPAPLPFIILPLVSAVFVDILNSIIIHFFIVLF